MATFISILETIGIYAIIGVVSFFGTQFVLELLSRWDVRKYKNAIND